MGDLYEEKWIFATLPRAIAAQVRLPRGLPPPLPYLSPYRSPYCIPVAPRHHKRQYGRTDAGRAGTNAGRAPQLLRTIGEKALQDLPAFKGIDTAMVPRPARAARETHCCMPAAALSCSSAAGLVLLRALRAPHSLKERDVTIIDRWLYKIACIYKTQRFVSEGAGAEPAARAGRGAGHQATQGGVL
jgi:hypothetical protein